MFKQLFTLARGRSADGAEAFLDANALAILRQQIRDAAGCVEKSRKALAMVMAYCEREKRALEGKEAKILDLELRATKALESDQIELATEAAGTIAHLETERDATKETIAVYNNEIKTLRENLTRSETVLAQLKRGQRLAEANDKSQRVHGQISNLHSSNLEEASATLKRLQERQSHTTATVAALEELSAPLSATSMSDRLAEAGCGLPKKSDADIVLARLKRKAN